MHCTRASLEGISYVCEKNRRRNKKRLADGVFCSQSAPHKWPPTKGYSRNHSFSQGLRPRTSGKIVVSKSLLLFCLKLSLWSGSHWCQGLTRCFWGLMRRGQGLMPPPEISCLSPPAHPPPIAFIHVHTYAERYLFIYL